jgi:ABC-type bacteriocin/lantibiotic exporter with double-glycine peptidase domain
MVAKHYGKEYSLEYLRDNCFLTREGVSLFGISEAAEKIGFDGKYKGKFYFFYQTFHCNFCTFA